MKPTTERAGPPVPVNSRISDAKNKAARAGGYAPAPVQFPVFEYEGQPVADSRDVALFVEKDHAHLLRDIRRYVKAMEKFNESNVGFVGTTEGPANTKLNPAGYFIEAAYIPNRERERMEAVEQALVAVGADIPSEVVRKRLRTAILLNVENGRAHPYERLRVDAVGRAEFYRRRDRLLADIASYLGMV